MAFYSDNNNSDDLDLDFNPDDVVKTKFEPIPAGWQRFEITKVEIVKAGKPVADMKQAKVELTCRAEEYAGRKVWARLTVATTSTADGKQTSLKIGREQVKELFEAAGIGGTSLAPLVGHEVDVKLSVRPETDQYDAANDIKGFRAIAGLAKPAAAGTKAAGTSRAKAPGFMANKKPKAETPIAPPEPEDDSGEGEAEDT